MAQDTKTKPSVWTKVFRCIVARLETDPDIRRVVGVQNIRSWNGSSGDKNPFTPSVGAPVLRLTPQFGNVSWYSEDSQSGDLKVRVEIAVESLNLDNLVDIYDLIVHALSPMDNEFCRSLVALGAVTGQCTFSDVASNPQPEGSPEGFFLGTGGFSLEVARQVNVGA